MALLDMSEDVKKQMINEIKTFSMFSLQVDKTADVASCTQSLIFVRCIHLRDLKEEFLFCSELKATARSKIII